MMCFNNYNCIENGKLKQMRLEKEAGVRNDFLGPANDEQEWS